MCHSLLFGVTAKGKLMLLQMLTDGDEAQCCFRNRESEGRHSHMRCSALYVSKARAFPGWVRNSVAPWNHIKSGRRREHVVWQRPAPCGREDQVRGGKRTIFLLELRINKSDPRQGGCIPCKPPTRLSLCRGRDEDQDNRMA